MTSRHDVKEGIPSHLETRPDKSGNCENVEKGSQWRSPSCLCEEPKATKQSLRLTRTFQVLAITEEEELAMIVKDPQFHRVFTSLD